MIIASLRKLAGGDRVMALCNKSLVSGSFSRILGMHGAHSFLTACRVTTMTGQRLLHDAFKKSGVPFCGVPPVEPSEDFNLGGRARNPDMGRMASRISRGTRCQAGFNSMSITETVPMVKDRVHPLGTLH